MDSERLILTSFEWENKENFKFLPEEKKLQFFACQKVEGKSSYKVQVLVTDERVVLLRRFNLLPLLLLALGLGGGCIVIGCIFGAGLAIKMLALAPYILAGAQYARQSNPECYRFIQSIPHKAITEVDFSDEKLVKINISDSEPLMLQMGRSARKKFEENVG
ncbi:MAG: hypothetical protein E7053_02345 [Lentisphaerae bacterium]|nr:hypothetical protein [Lentisphaerota bacterium]